MRPVPLLPPDVLAAIGASPGHLIGSRALNTLGHDSWRITDWVRRGLLERVAPGWYRIPGDEPLMQSSHLAQAYVHGGRPADPFAISGGASLMAGGCAIQPPARPLVLVSHGRRVRLPEPTPFRVLQRTGLAAMPTVGRGRLRCADLATSLADMVMERRLPESPRGDATLGAELYTVINRLQPCTSTLVGALARMDHPGARRLSRLARAGAFEHESPAEWTMFQEVFLAHPPAPDCQVWLTPRIRVDFVYLFAALVIEYHGEAAHADAVDDDATRTYTLRQLGLDTLVVTKSMTRDKPALAHHIHDVRRQREDLMLRGQLRHPPLPVQPRPRLTPLRTLHPFS